MIRKLLLTLALVATVGSAFAAGGSLDPRADQPEMAYKFLLNVQRSMNGYSLGSSAIASATVYATVVSSPAYVINGVNYAAGTLVATTTVSMIGTGRHTVPTGYYCYFLVVTNAAGAASVVQGRSYPTDRGVDAYPVQPENTAVIGGIKVYARANPFIPGSSFLTHADYNVTIYQLSRRPLSMTNL